MTKAVGVPRSRLVPKHGPSIARTRLVRRMEEASRHQVVVVVAPAGSGKTTAVAQFVAEQPIPSLWYRLAPSDADPNGLLASLASAIGRATGDPDVDRTVDGVLAALDDLAATAEGEPAALVVLDEVDEVFGAEASAVLADVVRDLPPGITLVLCGRREPDIELDLLRVRGQLDEIGPDDLRFRSWEISELFDRLYEDPVAPGDVAELERRTGGWAAGIHLFHLATRGRSPRDRATALERIGRRRGPGWAFLADHVLADLPGELRDFLEDTVALGRLEPELCDELRGRDDSADHLDELIRRRLFVVPTSDGAHVYHEVLRLHLEGHLVDSEGEEQVRQRHRRAGEVLLARGLRAEAARSFQRAEAWDRAVEVLGEDDAPALTGALPSTTLPEAVRTDPWVQLGLARRHRADGDVGAAVDAYRFVEDHALGGRAGDLARVERLEVQAILDPMSRQGVHPEVLRLRDGLRADPLDHLDPAGRAPLVDAWLLLFGGATTDAADRFDAALTSAGDPVSHALAGAGRLLVRWLLAEDEGDVLAANSVLETVPWVARMQRAALALHVGEWRPIAHLCDVTTERGDPVGRSFGRFAAALAARAGIAGAAPRDPSTRSLLPVVDAVADAIAPPVDADRAELARRCRRLGVPRIGALLDDADAALGALGWRRLGTASAPVAPAPPPGGAGDDPPSPDAGLVIRGYGGLAVELDGVALPLDDLRPRSRDVLRLLVSVGGAPLHRDRIAAAFWPDDDAAHAQRKVQTAVSAIRTWSNEHLGTQLVLRDSECYRLDPDAAVHIDVRDFDDAVTAGRRAHQAGDDDAAVVAFERALAIASEPVCPEAGAVDWAVDARERRRSSVVAVADELSGLHDARGDLDGCMAALEAGLAVDRFAVGLWTKLEDAAARCGNGAVAARVSVRYAQVLADLDVQA